MNVPGSTFVPKAPCFRFLSRISAVTNRHHLLIHLRPSTGGAALISPARKAGKSIQSNASAVDATLRGRKKCRRGLIARYLESLPPKEPNCLVFDYRGGRTFLLAAAPFNCATSFTVSERYFPGSTSKTIGPNCTRLIFSTSNPISLNIRRICRLRPSIKTTSYQGFGVFSAKRIFAGEVFTRRPSSNGIEIPLRSR